MGSTFTIAPVEFLKGQPTNIVKVRVPGGETVYAIPEHAHTQVAPEDHVRRVLSEWAVDVAVSVDASTADTYEKVRVGADSVRPRISSITRYR